MAYIETRETNQGTMHWVRWRSAEKKTEAGAPKPEGERFTDRRLAEKFKADVEYHGHRYPRNFVPKHGYVTETELAVMQDLARRAAAPPMPLIDAVHDYVNHLSGIQPKTRADYHGLVSNLMAPFAPFAEADIADLGTFTKRDVGDWVNWLADGERDPEDERVWLRTRKAPKTISNAHGLLHAAAKSFTEGERPLRRFNPCAGTNLPTVDDAIAEEDVFLTGADYEILRAAAKPKHWPIIDAFMGTGMRFGELAAQQVRDYTPGVQTRVQRAWHTIAGQQRELDRPKGKRGRRRISLDPATDEAFARCAHGKSDPEAFVFTAERGGPLRHNHFYLLCWLPTVYRAVRCEQHRAADRETGRLVDGEMLRLRQIRQLDASWLRPCLCAGTLTKVPRVHDLRHSHVSWLIAKGVPLGVISRRIGHDDVSFTDTRYGHLMPESERQAADAIRAIRTAAAFPVRLSGGAAEVQDGAASAVVPVGAGELVEVVDGGELGAEDADDAADAADLAQRQGDDVQVGAVEVDGACDGAAVEAA